MPHQTADRLVNPRTRTSESVNHGRFLYETFCLVCHGAAGRGDGPISSVAGGAVFWVGPPLHNTTAPRPPRPTYPGVVSGAGVGEVGRGNRWTPLTIQKPMAAFS